ncbi:MAG TPA: lipid IV(A) 3-deoxy-D-manno-octulosonic acid transferase [Burkholderiaceae bacterium]|nr:lipid IV(A) 3-deoxy-D-manno-octulosonic acid transferase [Burkholderiaceae bacterium]
MNQAPGSSGTLPRLLYSALLQCLTPVYLLRVWWRGRKEPVYRLAMGERLGHYEGQAPRPGLLWVHAVSLGETRAAAPLIKALRDARPGLRLLLTHGTATGRAAGAELLQPGDVQVWLPFDTPGAVRRFLRRFKPSVGVLMETEVWPNLLHEAQAAAVPLVLANARLSPRSFERGRRFRALLRPAVQALTEVLAQSEGDAQRLREAGAAGAKVAGNLKFDMTPPPALLDVGRSWRESLGRPVVLAASTREGEEVGLLAAWKHGDEPRPLLLIVPRHPQRFDAVADLVHDAGLRLVRRSSWVDHPPKAAREADVWLGDSMGEMPLYYAASDIALLGGSFAPFGGQNLIEAAACGCPVVMGPHTFNFSEAARLAVGAGAALRVVNVNEGVSRAIALTRDGGLMAMSAKASAFAQAHRGAAAVVVRHVLALIAAR